MTPNRQPNQSRRGEQNARAKIAAAQADEIRVLLENGFPTDAVAKRYDLSPRQVARIRAGDSWQPEPAPERNKLDFWLDGPRGARDLRTVELTSKAELVALCEHYDEGDHDHPAVVAVLATVEERRAAALAADALGEPRDVTWRREDDDKRAAEHAATWREPHMHKMRPILAKRYAADGLPGWAEYVAHVEAGPGWAGLQAAMDAEAGK